jgi:hypothetical protein
MLIAKAFALSKARLKIVNVCFLKKKMHFISLFGEYQENYFVYRKFLLERCLAFCIVRKTITMPTARAVLSAKPG